MEAVSYYIQYVVSVVKFRYSTSNSICQILVKVTEILPIVGFVLAGQCFVVNFWHKYRTQLDS